MSKKIAPRVQFNFEPDPLPNEITDINLETGEHNQNFVYDDEPVSVDSKTLPEVIEREEIVEDNIFEKNVFNSKKSKANKKDLTIVDVDEQLAQAEPPSRPSTPEPVAATPKPRRPAQKLNKNGKPKREISEAHREKLAIAREKALVARRAKAAEKKRLKEIENETKKLRQKKMEKDLEDLKSNVEKPVPAPAPAPVSMNSFTRKDLEEAQLSAIIQYETLRKARKEEKKKQQLIEQQRDQMKRQINRYGAKDTNGRLLNPYDRCY